MRAIHPSLQVAHQVGYVLVNDQTDRGVTGADDDEPVGDPGAGDDLPDATSYINGLDPAAGLDLERLHA
ncbi:MAG: hypothetical protein QF719_02810 [Chloroflexota bacterium]|jgi:hypothetical protein|nr:hypothetical protein [Chloroflexota bacterium]MDP6757134.1 hypothetical protein [Chloroflexota bacterium]